MKYSFWILLLCSLYAQAQISGRITDSNYAPIPYATVYVHNTPYSTITNKNGEYFFKQLQYGKHKISCLKIDFQSQTKTVDYTSSTSVDFTLPLENYSNSPENNNRDFGKKIIKKAIQNRKENAELLSSYSHSFYSIGNMTVPNFPKKFIGYDVEQLDPNLKLDSLKNQSIYTSELFSNTEYKKPNRFREDVVAHRTQGNNQGIDFHSAYDANFDFYKNEIHKKWKIISPIANNSLIYYNFEYINHIIDPISNQKIFKIKVLPIRDADPVVDGYIYIVDNSFEIYATQLYTTGYRLHYPQIERIDIRQQYVYNHPKKAFVKTSQTINFSGKILLFDFFAEYHQLYSNWKFDLNFPKKHFSQQLINYPEESQLVNNNFWQKNRPISLTPPANESQANSFQNILEKNTQKYKDSVDKVNNKFNPFKLILGYKYRNSYKNETYKYHGLLSTFAFNAIQGFNVTTGLSYLKKQPEKETFYEIGGLVNYGIAENKPRFSGHYTQLFNRINYAKLEITGGSVVHQFGEDFPIKKLINSVYSSYFGKNFAKFYNKEFLKLAYEQEVFNGITGKIDLEYANRRPLKNHTTNSSFVKNKLFSSNNPLDPTDFENAGFSPNHIFKLKLKTTYHIGQKYISFPHKKVNVIEPKYPILYLGYEQGWGLSNPLNDYTLINFSTKYKTSLGILGYFGLYANAGKFFNSDHISFMDFKHFYGNETPFGTSNDYLEKFNLMPYYAMSTNKDFVEWHAEHNFKGFILNKIPLMNKLQYHLIIGAHGMQTKNQSPYFEYSIGLENVGFKNFRPFRVDYFFSNTNGNRNNGIVIGIKLLDKIQ